MNNQPENVSSALVPIPSRGNGQLAPMASQTAFSDFPEAAALLKALRRRWRSALLVALICAGGVYFAIERLMPPPKHMARSLLQISNVAPKIFFPTGESQSPPFERYQRTQIVLAKSRLVLNSALRQPEVAKLPSIQTKTDPVLWLEKSIKVDFSLGPEVLSISLTGDDPQELVTIVNAVTKAYTEEIVNKDSSVRQIRLAELKKISSEFSGKIQAKQQVLRKVALAAGSRDSKNLVWKQMLSLEQLGQARKELTAVQSDLRKLRLQRNARLLQEQVATASTVLNAYPIQGLPVPVVLAVLFQDQQPDWFLRDNLDPVDRLENPEGDKHLNENPGYQRSFQRVAGIEARMQVNSFYLSPKSPSFKETMKALEAELAEAKRELAVKLREFAKMRELQLQRDLSAKERLEQALLDDVARLAKESGSLNESTIKVEEMRESIGYEEDMIRKLAAETDALEAEQRAPSRVTNLEEAALHPGQPGRKEMIIVGGATLGTFGLVLFLFAWLEFRCRRIDSPSDVVQSLGIRLVGTVPDSNPRSSSAKTRTRIHNLVAISIDTARTMFLHAAKQQRLKVVLITSALPGEGKTSTAAHLAVSLARSGRKTLLIDADLRKPNLHHLFNVQRTPGFSELVQGQGTIENATRQSSVPHLSLIPAGQGGEQAIQALANEAVSGIFAQLRQQFEFVIVDCAPILPVSDSLVLAHYADAAILSVMRDVSQLLPLYQAHQKLSFLDVHILGAIVNGAHEGDYYSSYYSVPVKG